MCGSVAEYPKQSLHQVHQASVFASFRLGLKGIEGQKWFIAAKCFVNQP